MSDTSLWPDGLASRLPDLMRAAIVEARKGDQPFGCALADFETGEMLGLVANSASTDPTGHGEVNALRLMASLKLDPNRVVLVSTAEPCPMCAAASWWGGVRGVIWGTTIDDLTRFGWKQVEISCKDLLSRTSPANSMLLQGGYLSDETNELYESPPWKKLPEEG